MSRSVFAVDDLLDAARSCVLTQGARKTTVAGVARASGAPVGSIYHRFAGIDDVLAAVWTRAVHRSQAVHEQIDTGALGPPDAAAEFAVASFDFCLEHPEDVRLLEQLTRRDVLGLTLSATARSAVREVDDRGIELMRLAAERIGDGDLTTVTLVAIDLPQTFARSALVDAGGDAAVRRAQLASAVRAVMATPHIRAKRAITKA